MMSGRRFRIRRQASHCASSRQLPAAVEGGWSRNRLMSKRTAGQPNDREKRLKEHLQEALKQHKITADELGLISLDEVKRAIKAVDDAFSFEPGDDRLLKNLLPRHGFDAVAKAGTFWRRRV
jgi:hypothetical protein